MSGKGINILTPEQEEVLRKELEKWWNMKDSNGRPMLTGMEIAKKCLGFGDPNIPNNPYVEIPPERIYYYRKKFNLPLRDEGYRHPRRYAYGKQESVLDLDKFIERIEAIPRTSFNNRRKRAGVSLGFWGGARNSENRNLRRKDFDYTEDQYGNELLRVNLYRLKKGRRIRKEDTLYPIELRLTWPFVREVANWIEQFNPEERPWPVTRKTWWRWHKEILGPNFYPHYLRQNVITIMCSDPRFSIAEIRAWTGLHLITIQNYISKSRRFTLTATEKINTYQVHKAPTPQDF